MVSETDDSSIESTPSALKLRLQNLPPPIEAVKLAAVKLNVRKERDLYLHVQGLNDPIEEKDEPEVTISTTDSSKIVIDSESNRRSQGQVSKARVRRREKLNSGLAMSQRQQSSDLHICSSGLSSPEALSLREIREYFRGETNQAPNSDFEDSQSMKKPVSHTSPEVKNPHKKATYTIPTKFGGYRPTSGLIFRNLSSDSDSEATSERIDREKSIQDVEEQTLRGRDFVSSHSFCIPDRIMQVEPFSAEEIEDLESRLISPVPSTDSRHSFGESSPSQSLRMPQETAWESMSPSERNQYLDSKIGNMVEQSSLVDSPIRHSDNETDITDSFRKVENSTFGKNSKITPQPLPENHISLQAAEIEDLVIHNENQNFDSAGDSVQPNIPPLEIDYSQSQSLSSDAVEETNRSSLDVSALIQALSDVSIRQEKNTTYRTNRSMGKLKSPLGYGNRFSGSSGPRSSEYTPAAGGSRQSLTSQEASETHSVRNCRAEVRSRVITESNANSGKLSSRSPKALEEFTNRDSTLGICAESKRLDSDFIPVVAKVEKTNLVCPKHSSRVNPTGKLISPKKYPNTEFGGRIVESLTSRTDVSQSSEGCQKSFRSLKSVPVMSKASEVRINSPCQPGTLSGRRMLEPLNSVPKIQPDLMTSLNRKINRRRKTANDLAQIINSQFDNNTTCSSRRSPSSQSNRVNSPNHRFAKRRDNTTIQPKKSPDTRSKSLVHHTEVLSSRTPGEPLNNVSRPTTECHRESVEPSLKCGESSCASSARSSLTSGNTLYLRSERHSMSSGDYEGRTNWSSPSRDDGLTGNNDTYNVDDEQQGVGAHCKITSGGIADVISPKFAANYCAQESSRLSRNCVYLNDLQDGREVILPCRNAHPEDGSRERELFEHLPNEISASLTRHSTFGVQVTENLQSGKETPSTFEDLRKNIQQNNDQWLKNFKNDNDLRHPLPDDYSDLSPDDKLVSSASSPRRFRNSRNSIRNQTKIPLKIPFVDHRTIIEPTVNSCIRTSMSSGIDPDSSTCSSPLYRNSRQEAECNSESARLDSQRSLPINSGSNYYRNSTVVEFDETLEQKVSRKHLSCSTIAEHCASESDSLRKETIVTNKSHKDPSPDEYDEETHNSRSAQVISVSNDYAEEPPEVSKFENAQNTKCDSILNTELECGESEESGHDHNEDEEQSMMTTYDQENHLASELNDVASTNFPGDSNLTIHKDNEFGVCGTKNSPNSNKSSKSQTSRQHIEEAMISSPVKPVLSLSKLNLSTDSKWDLPIMQSGANNLRKSQDRFPFTISESASRKTSKYKVVADVSLGQMIQDKNPRTGSNDAQQLILENVDDGEAEMSDMIDTETKIEFCSQTPFLEELTNKISNDFPQSWTTEIPFIGPNYISYGCRSEQRALMPTMKGIVKKFSAKLRYSRAKRRQDSEETNVEILYRNKKCRFDSGEGSSSAASMYQSQFITTNKLVTGSTSGSRASSANAVKPKRNYECINVSMEQKTGRGCDRNDMWIQEFDSDVEFGSQEKPDAMPCTSSPVNDRYSMFLARRTFSGIINERTDRNDRLDVSEGGDNEKVTSIGTFSGTMLSKTQDLLSKSPKPPPNSTNKFDGQTSEDDFDDPTVKTGCCCFRIYNLIATSKKHSSKTHRIEVWDSK